MPNRLSADYREEIERPGFLRVLKMVEEFRKQATEGGRVYGQVKLPRKAQQPPEEMMQ